MKRRIRLRPRFWVILATLIIGSVILSSCNKACEETQKFYESEEIVVREIEKNDIYLEIPLSDELQDRLYDACEEFGVDFYVMVALIDRETNFHNVIGDNGESYGYCQIQPRWWSGLMEDIGAEDLCIPQDNFRTACAILSQLTDRYGSVEGALVAYNQGYYRGTSTLYSRCVLEKAESYRKEKCRTLEQ